MLVFWVNNPFFISVFLFLLITGENGIKNGLPKDLMLDKLVIKNIKPKSIPIIPSMHDNIIIKYLYSLINDWKSWYEKNIEDIAVNATTITIIGETIPAETAASPRTNAPKIERDVPLEVGVKASASYKISKVIIRISNSITAGNGTLDLCNEKLISKSVGSICWSYVVKDKYIAGANIVINRASILINFTKYAKKLFW